ncbi:asparagine synthase (glutamine-hydrolyzing), partial [candidate division WWE3 bacterium]|nr:asparagine synthase (glutamine-hydrolyzing) [candidate division WWE3 bacterium]
MCGITGIIEKKRGIFKDRQGTLKIMTDAIRHRGPDDEAFFNSEVCSLGMRRLAILDLTPGLYPFSNKSKTVQLVFNGEIYNYPDLKKELEVHGYKFLTHCDGEAIVHGYDLWGTNVFTHLRGMFAIALWDEKEKKLVVARDRIGIKPVYFINNSEYFAFASEVKSFIAARNTNESPISLSLDTEQVQNLIGFMFLPESGKTIISEVKKLEPGCFMEITKDKTSVVKYWSINNVKKSEAVSYDQAVTELDNLLTDVVSNHLLSDVPLGLMLSGGVDSGLLAAIMTKKLGVETHSYTARFDHASNESNLAKETAAYLGTIHKDFFIDVSDINNNIDDYIKVFDDLTTFDGGLITTSILAKIIQKEGIKVLLLGEGADELFGGYSWFGLSQLPFSLLPKPVRDSIYYYAISRNYSFNFLHYSGYWSKKY